MLDWIAGLLNAFVPSKVPVRFHLDEDGGELLVRASVSPSYGSSRPIGLRQLGQYGSTLKLGGQLFRLGSDVFQTALAVRDADPEYRDDGTASLDFQPGALEYLRTRHDVEESESVSEYEVRRGALEPQAEVDYDPSTGASVSVGVRDTDRDEMLDVEEGAEEVADGEWLRVGNRFYPTPDLSDDAEELLEEGYREIPLEEVPEFFTRDLVLLESEFSAVLTDNAKQVSIEQAENGATTVEVVKTEDGWLDFDVEYGAGEKTVSHSDLVRQEDPSDPVQVGDHTWMEVDEHDRREVDGHLNNMGAEQTEDGFKLDVTRYQDLEDFIESLGGQREVDSAYRDFLAGLQSFERNPNYTPPLEIESRLQRHNIDLRDYQRAGIHWLDWLRDNHLHGLLADDMGLGKTLQVIVALAVGYRETGVDRPSLVVCPKSVMGHWEEETNKVVASDEIEVRRYHGLSRSLSDFRSNKPRIVVSTYGTVRSDVDELRSIPLFGLIVDEATKIKNPNAKRTQAVKSLNASFRVGLSGTPIENETSELWSIFDFLMPGHLGQYGTFKNRFADPIEEEDDEKVQEELKNRVKQFFVRRTKGEVADQLPEKIPVPHEVELSDEQRALYSRIQKNAREVRDRLRSEGDSAKGTALFGVITKLKQVCVHPGLLDGVDETPVRGRSNKVDRALEKVDEILEGGDQGVVFSQFLKPLDLFERVYPSERRIRIDGDTDNRQSLIEERFNSGSAELALCSTRAAAHGINLQEANHVIHLDAWWNPAIQRQATDRVHRIGQDQTVYVYEFWVEDTLEQKIRRLLQSKQDLADRIITSDMSSIVRQMDADQLAELLQPIDG